VTENRERLRAPQDQEELVPRPLRPDNTLQRARRYSQTMQSPPATIEHGLKTGNQINEQQTIVPQLKVGDVGAFELN
jgi:hypothetical protein